MINIAAPSPQTSKKRGRIAIVDDDPVYQLLLTKILAGHNYAVEAFDSGQNALTEIFRSPPEIALLDVGLPDMDGYEVAQHLKENPVSREMPILFISGLDAELDKVKAFTTGAVDYITKPFHIEEILARIETHLSLNRLQRRLEHANQALQNVNETLEDRVRTRTAELKELNEALECFVPRESLRFLSKDSLAQIRRGDHIEKEMTIMFADIRSFTELSEKMSPQENFDFINSYLNFISPPISHHNGFIDKYTGDGIMAVFPNHPSDAVKAAMAMQTQLLSFNRERVHENKIAIKVGIGLHSGSVMFGTVGNPKRMDVTVISDAVNLAFRMQELTKQFLTPIIASEATIDQLKDNMGLMRTQALGAVTIRGKSAPIGAFAIQPQNPVDAFLWAA